MGGKNDSPNYQQAAIAQGEANREAIRDQTYANRPTQYTPWGYQTWNPYEDVDPATGQAVTRWEQMTGLSPQLQSILDMQLAMQQGRTDTAMGLTDRMRQEYGQGADFSGVSPLSQAPIAQYTRPEGDVGDPYQTRQRAEDMVYNQAVSRLQPQFDSRRQQLEIKLRNQGLSPEDAAYKAQMGALGRQETDAYNQAMFSASEAGRAESGQMFGQQMGRNQNMFNQALGSNQQNFQQAMAASQYANQIRQQQLAEIMQQRGFSLNEMNALLSGQQVGMPQMPSFTGAGAAQPTPVYQGAVDQGNFDQMGQQGMMGGLGGLINAGLSAYGMGML